jgi:hypothetical protein
MSKTTPNVTKSNLTTPKVASRVQSATATSNGGVVPKGSVAGRMQRTANHNFGKSGSK